MLAAMPLSAAGEQEKEEGKKEPPRMIRLLPVGDAPPFRQEVRDGVRYEIEPPAGSVPPRKVTVETGGEAAVEARLLLGITTPPLEVPAAMPGVSVLDAQGKPWLKVAFSQPGDFLAVVWRDSGASWDKPRSMLLPEVPFVAGILRVVNTTAATVRVSLGNKEQTVGAGKTALYRAGVTGGLPLKLAWLAGDGAWRPFYSTALTMNEAERGQVILYRADPAPGRLPVKVVFLREKVKPPKVAEP